MLLASFMPRGAGMGRVRLVAIDAAGGGGNARGGLFMPPEAAFQWSFGGAFASVGQVGSVGFGGISPASSAHEAPAPANFAPPAAEVGARVVGVSAEVGRAAAEEEEEEEEEGEAGRRRRKGFRLRIKIKNQSLRRLLSGAIAGALSRTAVAPLETIRTHLMVGSSGHSTAEVFQNIMVNEGWTGLFRGNFVNVVRVAPSKAVELFAYDTVRNHLTPKTGEAPKLPVPASLVAGACAGVSSTLLTYPLELIKTRLTIQRGVYDNFLHAFVKILKEEGLVELYRGLTPSLIGVVPYAATNYFAYDTLRKAYKKILKKEEIDNISTLLIGSAAGAFASSATFPLEVARKHMQVGAVSGRQVYKNMLHALISILEQEGVQGLYRGLGPSCMKLVPAAGMSFMCYEACKRILVENEEDEA